jgi:hypothetical protein
MADKIKKLSQAIRLGATFKPQYFGSLCNDRHNPQYTCALGAALDAICKLDAFVNQREDYIKILKDRFNIPFFELPVIIRQNDKCKISREMIADTLEHKGY